MYILSHMQKTPQIPGSHSQSLWSQRIYISSKFPGDAYAAGLENTLEEISPLNTSFSHLKREEIQERGKKNFEF